MFLCFSTSKITFVFNFVVTFPHPIIAFPTVPSLHPHPPTHPLCFPKFSKYVDIYVESDYAIQMDSDTDIIFISSNEWVLAGTMG